MFQSRSCRNAAAVLGVGIAAVGAALPVLWWNARHDPLVTDISRFMPKQFPNAPQQAKEFAQRITEALKGALKEGKPVVAWVQVIHVPRGGFSEIEARKVPHLIETIERLIGESQFEAAWALNEIPGPHLFVSESAKSIEGQGSLGQEVREISGDVFKYLFPNGLPRDFEGVNEEQQKFLYRPGASAITFASGKFDRIYPPGDERTLDAIDEKLAAIEAANGGVLPSPFPPEVEDLVYRQREEELVRNLQSLIGRPEHAGKVIALEYGRKHGDMKERLAAAGFVVVEVDCGTVFEQFQQNIMLSVVNSPSN